MDLPVGPSPYVRRCEINSRSKRARRRILAQRDGLHCAYCQRPFADPQQATLDHVVPRRLLPSWDPAFLVLACGPCNQAKGDRMPWLVALLLLARATGARNEETTPGPAGARVVPWSPAPTGSAR